MKNGNVYHSGKVDSYDLKSVSFEFGNDTLITFEKWNAKGILQKTHCQNEHFVAIPSIGIQRSFGKVLVPISVYNNLQQHKEKYL